MQKKLTPIATPRAGIFVIQPSLMLYSTKAFTDQPISQKVHSPVPLSSRSIKLL
jgi:hypothetical protein